MRFLYFAVTAIASAITFSASAKQICAEIGESPVLRDRGQEVLADGSVVFKNPEVLVRNSQYLPIAANSESFGAFCLAHGLKNVVTYEAKSSTATEWGGATAAKIELVHGLSTVIKNEIPNARDLQFTIVGDPHGDYFISVTCRP